MLILLFLGLAHGHGLLADPRQRGALNLPNHPIPVLDPAAPTDYQAHFPAGSKSQTPGAGTASQRLAAGDQWTPYNPYDQFFRWRAGVCGDDLFATQDHLLGGVYYHHGHPVRTFIQGSIISFQVELVTHHNGFFEFHVCNLDICGADISPKCFVDGHCRPLLRASSCDAGHPLCGPIDTAFPWRWYLPCRRAEPELVGGATGAISYALPPDLVCDRCVIQWYWTSANSCNPPGLDAYFRGPDRPNWGNCPGQGGAIGGWASNKPLCGGELFPEEYLQCADVRILPNAPPPPPPPPPPAAPIPPTAPAAPESGTQPPPSTPPPQWAHSDMEEQEHWDEGFDNGNPGPISESSSDQTQQADAGSALGLHHSQT